jgi:hypothetical protein
MQHIIRLRSQTYDVARQDGVKDVGRGETRPDTTTVTVTALLFDPIEVQDSVDFGERMAGDLNGLCQPSADVQVSDVYTHGTDDYEVIEVTGQPSDEDTIVLRFGLEKVTNT